MIEIRELYKYYGDRRAVGPLSVSIEKGEIVGLLGLNGAGKTTTLRVLACDLLPTSGSVLVEGVDVVERPDEVRTKIGYLPESPPVYSDMTVGEYLVFVARLRGVSPADVEKRVSEVIELTAIGPERDQYIFSLSHGYRQRVGIAQAIVHRPSLVVLDEPISGLDPVQIVEMRELVRNLGGEHTVVVSSHILSEISETCDRILVIRDGEIVASGTEAQLSARVLRGMQVDVTVRLDAPGFREVDEVARLLGAVRGVGQVEPIDPSEQGPAIATLRVYATEDVRDELCKKLVASSIPLLELARGERELERVFAELSRTETDGAPRRAKRRKKRAERVEPIDDKPSTDSEARKDGAAPAEEAE